MKTLLITPEGLEKLKAELDHLWRVERTETTQKVNWAASLGDRPCRRPGEPPTLPAGRASWHSPLMFPTAGGSRPETDCAGNNQCCP